jgi:glucose-6-phosphate isomerase
VGLFPLAVAGVDIQNLLKGAFAMQQKVRTIQGIGNPAIGYAILRSLIRKKGIILESLVTFEPDLQHFTRWWIQLFAETEGKTDQVLFPIGFSYSEDLHAVGQYVQQGPRILLETFLDLHYAETNCMIKPSNDVVDGFSYMDGKPFSLLNKAVYQAALEAHSKDGIPCIELKSDCSLNAESLGGLFYFFLFSAYLSARLLGVNPFDQEGVEQYKRNMYAGLGKSGYTK